MSEKNEPRQIHIQLPRVIVTGLDNLARIQYTSRSEVIKQAVLAYMRKMPEEFRREIGFIEDWEAIEA